MSQRMTLERAYREWLRIPAEKLPPDHYTLLDLPQFEADPQKIERAILTRTMLARKRTFKHHAVGTELQNAIAAAGVCLADPGRKAEYDAAVSGGKRHSPSTEPGQSQRAIGISLWSDPPGLSYLDEQGAAHTIQLSGPGVSRLDGADGQVLAADVRQLLQQSEPVVGVVRAATFATPFSLDASGREALRQAAAGVGIAAVEVVEENALAAIWHTHELLQQGGDAAWEMGEFFGDRAVLVVDFSQTSLRVSLLKVRVDLQYEELASADDKLLGSADWDDVVARLLLDKFHRAFTIAAEDRPRVQPDLSAEAVRVRSDLTRGSRASIVVAHNQRRRILDVTRADFQRAAEPLLFRLEMLLEEMLNRAACPWSSIESVILLNEAAALPMVQNRLELLTKRQAAILPPGAISRGAAFAAARRSQPPTRSPPKEGAPQAMVPAALGLMTYDPVRGIYGNDVLIRSDQPQGAPAQRTLPLTPGMRRVELILLQGAAPLASDCQPLCRVIVNGFDCGQEAGELVSTFGFDDEGVLFVTAAIRSSRGVTSVPVAFEPIGSGKQADEEPVPPPVIIGQKQRG